MNPPDITVRHNPQASRFEAHVDGQLCVADYSLQRNTITFTHTEVPPSLQGHGIAGAMVREALGWCEREGLRVVPACSYVRRYIERHPQAQHLLAA